MPYEYHVAKNGSDLGKGTKEDPNIWGMFI